MVESKKTKGFSYRPRKEHAPRLERLVKATERTKAYFLDKALEKKLSEWEMEYADELRKYDKTRSIYPSHQTQGMALNDSERQVSANSGQTKPKIQKPEWAQNLPGYPINHSDAPIPLPRPSKPHLKADSKHRHGIPKPPSAKT